VEVLKDGASAVYGSDAVSGVLNIKLRTITLPSDRTAKNFYEANGITARILLMEEKRDKTRYRS
jgi:outer membrane receptor protein involved in Fe transport